MTGTTSRRWPRECSACRSSSRASRPPPTRRWRSSTAPPRSIVSNHGGRQLDGVPATLDILPEVVDAVGGRCEVLVDGGIRRGTDVVIALALGARAVLVGRAPLWGLAVGGEAGAAHVLELLRAEIELALTLLGCSSADAVGLEHVGPAEADRGAPIFES